MSYEGMHQVGIGRVGAHRGIVGAVASFALAFVSPVAFGAGPVAAPSADASSAGLVKFDNVRVVSAPESATAVPASNAGVRVFVDSATGQMRSPTPEEMQTMAASNSAPSSNKTQWYGVNGGIGVTLDDSFLQYSVVARQPDGSLVEYCVTGRDEADQLVRTAASPATSQNGGRDAR